MVLKNRNVTFSKKSFKLDLPKHKESKRVYLRLKPPVTKSLKKKLKKYDIELNNYVSDNTFTVKLNEKKLKKLQQLFSIDGFADIEPIDKVSKNLYKGNIGAHAKDGNYVKIIVVFYDYVSYIDAVSWIKSVGGTVLSNDFSLINALTVSIHQLGLSDLAELDEVKFIDEIAPPQTTKNVDAGKLSNVFWDNDGNTISGLFDKDYADNEVYIIKGKDIKIAVRDGGKIDSHIDFGTRLTIVDNDSVSSHATHVAGTIGGALMFDNDTGGMASESLLYSYSFMIPNTNDQDDNFTLDFISATATYGATIINNSWGYVIGYDESGLPSGTPISEFGIYDTYSSMMDNFIYSYFDNDALVLKSAGNDRDDCSRYDPTLHDGTLESDGNYYDLIDPVGCAKNVITVGSVGDVIAGSFNSKISSSFSSWGPTNDGRIKPDVVADGYYLKSTWLNNGYNSIPGTSMSCPVVSGICGLIHESYNDLYNDYPSSDIVKALLCNFAEDLGKKGPDYSYGFGLVDARAYIDAIEQRENNNWKHLSSGYGNIITGTIEETDDYCEYQFTISTTYADNEAVTLVWIDPPPGSTNVINAIVNDLDLYVFSDNSYYAPFYYKEYSDIPTPEPVEPEVDPTQPAGRGCNRYDTVEKVLMEADNTGFVPADTYTVHVTGFNVPTLDQKFAVVSSVGFNRFNFNSLKVKDRGGNWLSNTRGALVVDPDLLLKITDLDSGFSPAELSIQYSNTSDGGQNWSAWTNADGLYSDKDCTQSCQNPHTGAAYIKFESVEFDNESAQDNKIKFKLTYDSQTYYSRIYVVPHYNVYYVSTTGDDSYPGTKDDPMRTIQCAIDTAVGTDLKPALIYVQEGTYYPEDIDEDGDNDSIYLRNYVFLYGGYDADWLQDISNNQTIIQGDGTSSVVIGQNNAVLHGFYIQGGKASSGGGIYLDETSPLIENCVIRNNQATTKGAGICALNSHSQIIDCDISNNTISPGSDISGAGICAIDSSLYMKYCNIEDNSLSSSSGLTADGAGICFSSNDRSILINCYITGNTAYSKYTRGGGLYLSSSSETKVLNCIIYKNDCKQRIYNGYTRGDGIYCGSPDVKIINCLVYGNYGILNSSGHGIYRDTLFSVQAKCHIYNSIVWNHPNEDIYPTWSTNVYNNCIQDTTLNGINGNISSNPQFRDPSAEDFRLVNTSPCIDAGNDGAPCLDLIAEDFQGQKRIFEYDNSGTESVDIGAFEYIFGFTASSGMTMDNDGITLTWESISGATYYVEYTHDDLDNDSMVWTTVDNDGITGQATSTSWTDDGTEITPSYDNESVSQRFYRIFFEN